MSRAYSIIAGVFATVVAAVGLSFLYYSTSPRLPGFAVMIATSIVPLVASLSIWRSLWARILGFVLLVAVSVLTGFMTAVGVFHDAP